MLASTSQIVLISDDDPMEFTGSSWEVVWIYRDSMTLL